MTATLRLWLLSEYDITIITTTMIINITIGIIAVAIITFTTFSNQHHHHHHGGTNYRAAAARTLTNPTHIFNPTIFIVNIIMIMMIMMIMVITIITILKRK